MELAAASVTRSVDLPATVDEVWASLRDADGLAGWLGESVDLVLAPGAAGTVVESGAVRCVVVTEVVEGRSIGFAWWDESAPDELSTVTIAIEERDGGTTVSVTERLAGAAAASLGAASVADLAAVEGAAWDRRLQALVGECALSGACV